VHIGEEMGLKSVARIAQFSPLQLQYVKKDTKGETLGIDKSG
jgi:hypothetical protein